MATQWAATPALICRPAPALPSPGLALFICVAAILPAACARSPEPIDAPPPIMQEDISEAPNLPPSTLNVPVEFDLAPVIEDLEAAVPRKWGDLEQRLSIPGNSRLRVAVELEREPFATRLIADTAELTAIIHYSVKAWYNPPVAPEVSASCGTDQARPRPRARITLASRMDISENWSLQTRTRVKRVTPLSSQPRDECRVTALRFDVTGRVLQAAGDQLRKNAPAIDRALANIDLRSRFNEWWNVLQTPIEITDSVWLVIDPIAVRRGYAGGDNGLLLANVGLTALPRIVVGPRPQTTQKPLPKLEAGPVEDGLHILAEADIDYVVASEFLTRQLRGTRIDVGGRTIRIQSLRAFGVGRNRMALELLFDGSARGHVFFVGTPSLDFEAGEVRVPDLDFDVGSADALVRGLNWLAHRQLVDFLREQARLPIEDALARATHYLNDGLNYRIAGDARLRGEVASLRAIGVHPTRRSLVLQAHATAHAHLEVGQSVADEDSARSRPPAPGIQRPDTASRK